MIFGHVLYSRFTYFHPLIQDALSYLKNTDFNAMDPGEYSITDKFIVQVLDLTTQAPATINPEVHRTKIDIQFLYSGMEQIGISTDTGKNRPATDYIEARDIQFYEHAEHESFLIMKPGNFAIFYPEDVHRPACMDQQTTAIRKIVIKIELAKLNNEWSIQHE
jgi:YhcH/YjgK/YiaL family protein